MKFKIAFLMVFGWAGLTSSWGQWKPIENFDSQNEGVLRETQGWQLVSGKTGYFRVVRPEGRSLALGVTGRGSARIQWSDDFFSIQKGQIATLYFEFMAPTPEEAGVIPGLNVGFGTVKGSSYYYTALSALVVYGTGFPLAITQRLKPDSKELATLAVGAVLPHKWYRIWAVIDRAKERVTYYGEGEGLLTPQKLLGVKEVGGEQDIDKGSLPFYRDIPEPVNAISIGNVGVGEYEVYVDNFYFSHGENLAAPAASGK